MMSPETKLHRSPLRRFTRSAGFSLVEITLTLGIMAFALVAIFGLIPVGLNTFQKSQHLTIAQQISDRLSADVRQTNFNDLGELYLKTNANGSSGLGYSHNAEGTIVDWKDSRTAYYSKATADWNEGQLTKKGPFSENPDILIVGIKVCHYPVAGKTPWSLKDAQGNYMTSTTFDTYNTYVVVGNGVNTQTIK